MAFYEGSHRNLWGTDYYFPIDSEFEVRITVHFDWVNLGIYYLDMLVVEGSSDFENQH